MSLQVENNEAVLTAINKLNNTKRASSVSTLTYLTTYAKVPRDKLKYAMKVIESYRE